MSTVDIISRYGVNMVTRRKRVEFNSNKDHARDKKRTLQRSDRRIYFVLFEGKYFELIRVTLPLQQGGTFDSCESGERRGELREQFVP